MSDETRCTLCDCVLTIGGYEFTGHTPERCREWTVARISDLKRMLGDQHRESAILRDMMGRHVCDSARGGPR